MVGTLCDKREATRFISIKQKRASLLFPIMAKIRIFNWELKTVF